MLYANKKVDIKRQLETFKILIGYLKQERSRSLWPRLGVSLLILSCAKMANIFVPLLYKKTIDSLSAPLEGTSLLYIPFFLIIAYGVLRICAQMMADLKDILFARIEQSVVRWVALDTFKHLHELSLRFHLDRKTGGLTRVMERGTHSIEQVIYFSTFNVLPTLVEIIFVAILLWIAYPWIYGTTTFVTLIIYIAYTLFVTEWRTPFIRQMNQSNNESNARAVDSLLNYETVKYFGREAFELNEYNETLEDYKTAAILSKASRATLNIGQNFIISLGLIAVMLMASRDIQAGYLTLGDFVLVNAYLLQLYVPLNTFGFAYREIKLALINIEHIFTLLKEVKEISDASTAVPLRVDGGEVRFEHISFAYHPSRPLLQDLDFTVPSGHTCAIVGPSGCGKSTLSRLLFRFYDVQQGRITIDNQDIREVTQHSLRAALGIVPQDTVLFNNTLGYNIGYGRAKASLEEIQQAARLAQLSNFIEKLPDGYDTQVGERGLKLSGGEKQRVAIARTLLKSPKIFVFDEATSALDTRTEKSIQTSLDQVSHHRTTLIIAHRLSTITHAHEILVLDQGRIQERGTHSSLLNQQGLYAKMWYQQLQEKTLL